MIKAKEKYFEQLKTLSDALKREYKLKQLSHDEKQKLFAIIKI